MHAGKALTAIITATLISTFAHAATAKKASSKTTVAAATVKAKAKATKATKSKTAPAKAEPVAIPAVGDTSSIYDAEPWFDQPITAGKKASAPVAAAKKAKKTKAPKRSYGGAIGLGNRSTGAEPTVAERATDATPKLNQNSVRKVVRANDASVGYCQTRARRAKQNVGQQMLSFSVDAHGRASKITVTDMAGKKQSTMTRCMRRQMKRWKLPAGTRGGDVSMPLMHRQIGPSSTK